MDLEEGKVGGSCYLTFCSVASVCCRFFRRLLDALTDHTEREYAAAFCVRGDQTRTIQRTYGGLTETATATDHRGEGGDVEMGRG